MQNNRYRSKDYGCQPFVVDIQKATLNNRNFRTTLWTGQHMQLTLMCIPPKEDIGKEIHCNVDQFLKVECGSGFVRIGSNKDRLCFQQPIFKNSVIFIPAGTWHNIINTTHKPLKLYSIYSPPHHPKGTVHPTKRIAIQTEK